MKAQPLALIPLIIEARSQSPGCIVFIIFVGPLRYNIPYEVIPLNRCFNIYTA